ncbi:hypothetical protein N0V90_000846 [Kalmusia sp. IMI 367209]|nr:hypothetical protein N0V90_000846 [Kalmusia sp. IMI 367209]
MIARPRPTTYTTLPASLILTSRELKHYRRFQSQTTTLPRGSHDRLPTAVQYADFQSWLAKRDSGYFSDTPLADIAEYAKTYSEKKEEKGKASVCGHTLHPVHEDKTERCPVCTVEIHITYMKLLTAALQDAGGLVKQRWEAIDQDCPALQAWYAGKLAFVNEVHRLESIAQAEEEYSQQQWQQNWKSNQPTDDIKTAAQALELHWLSLESGTMSMQTTGKKAARTVDFSPQTNFERGRDQLYFWRKSPRYEANGEYASSSSSDVEESDGLGIGEDAETHEEKSPEPLVANDISTSRQDNDDAEHSDEQMSDEEGVESDEEENDEDDESDEEEDDEVDGTDSDYIAFAYGEAIIEGAEFVVFED